MLGEAVIEEKEEEALDLYSCTLKEVPILKTFYVS
jgi:hypothetical protein